MSGDIYIKIFNEGSTEGEKRKLKATGGADNRVLELESIFPFERRTTVQLDKAGSKVQSFERVA